MSNVIIVQHVFCVDTSQLSGQDRNQPAWWKVDLGASYDVYQVVITNRDGARGIIV